MNNPKNVATNLALFFFFDDDEEEEEEDTMLLNRRSLAKRDTITSATTEMTAGMANAREVAMSNGPNLYVYPSGFDAGNGVITVNMLTMLRAAMSIGHATFCVTDRDLLNIRKCNGIQMTATVTISMTKSALLECCDGLTSWRREGTMT